MTGDPAYVSQTAEDVARLEVEDGLSKKVFFDSITGSRLNGSRKRSTYLEGKGCLKQVASLGMNDGFRFASASGSVEP